MKKLKTMTFETKKRNRPIATLIKWYSDKESGKVVEARKEIQHRFDYLDWNVQKKILMAFLDAGQSDRQWAYRKIYRQWDKCFLEPIRTLWEEHHENTCVWSVVKYFPMEDVTHGIYGLAEESCKILRRSAKFHVADDCIADRLRLLYSTRIQSLIIETENHP